MSPSRTLKYHPSYITMPQYSIKHYEREYLYDLFIESAINSSSIL